MEFIATLESKATKDMGADGGSAFGRLVSSHMVSSGDAFFWLQSKPGSLLTLTRVDSPQQCCSHLSLCDLAMVTSLQTLVPIWNAQV